VVFRATGGSREPVVKRVVGLPGETIQLVDGNVIVDGAIARKPLEVQRAMAILVNDDRYRPQTAQGSDGALIRASCWQPRDEQASGWTLEPGKSRYRPRGSSPSTAPRQFDWIDFHPRQRLGAQQQPGLAASAGIDDHYAYNQSRPILELHAVSELLLRCELKASGAGQLALRAVDRDHEYEVRIELPGGAVRFLVDGHILDENKEGVAPLADEVTCEISTIDGLFLCAIDGELLFPPFELPTDQPINRQAATRRAAEGCFSIGATGATVDVRSAQVFRDIYYTRLPEGFADRAQSTGGWHVGADELFVLGDNSPFSQDSRVTPEPGVPISHLIGRPLLVHAPRRAFLWGGRQWNLLDLSRVRGVR
jgi:signal peptidase I